MDPNYTFPPVKSRSTTPQTNPNIPSQPTQPIQPTQPTQPTQATGYVPPPPPSQPAGAVPVSHSPTSNLYPQTNPNIPSQPTISYNYPDQPVKDTYAPTQEQQPTPSIPSQATPSVDQRVHHHHHFYQPPPSVIYVEQQRSSLPYDADLFEAQSASSAFSLAICVSLMLCCFGCFPLSCVPFWFVYVGYAGSSNGDARAIGRSAKALFWVTLVVNVCLFVASVLVVVIVPPAVIVPRYY